MTDICRYRFAGRLIGLAIIQGHLLDVFFARHVYKALLERYEIYLQDMHTCLQVILFSYLQDAQLPSGHYYISYRVILYMSL